MKRVLVILVVIVLMFASVACVRSKATEQQVPEGEEVPAEAGPEEKGDVMEQLQLFVTQTAMAAGGGQVEPGGEAQPEGETGTGSEGVPATDATPTPEGQVAGEEPTAAPVDQPTPIPTEVPPEPTSAPLVVVPTATPGIPTTHTIQKGESVFCISRRYDLNPNEVLALNNLGTGTIVSPGQVLKIPQTGNPFPGPRALHPHPDTYIVGRGETIYGVACFYGDVDPMAIAYANGLTAPYTLSEGQQLQIP